MELYAFYPGGHGEASFFVIAENEQQARSFVADRVKFAVDYMADVRQRQAWSDERAKNKDYNELEYIARSRETWRETPSEDDYYSVEVFESGQVAMNWNS